MPYGMTNKKKEKEEEGERRKNRQKITLRIFWQLPENLPISVSLITHPTAQVLDKRRNPAKKQRIISHSHPIIFSPFYTGSAAQRGKSEVSYELTNCSNLTRPQNMGQTPHPSFRRVETKFKTSQSFSNKYGWIHICYIYKRSLFPFVWRKYALYSHHCHSVFYKYKKSWGGKKDMQPDTFLKPASKVEVVSDTSEMKTFYLCFQSSA